MAKDIMGLYDLYMRQNIFNYCAEYFDQYLKEEGSEEDQLTEEDVETVNDQIEFILNMIKEIYTKYDDELKANDAIIDKLIGMCVVTKMNEVRLCRVLNEKIEDK